MALNSKKMAYHLHRHNIGGFGDLCENVWKHGKLDLRNMPFITAENSNLLHKMFGSLIVEIIYPANLTNQLLCHLPNAKTFTFYTELDWTPIVRPTLSFPNKINLTVHGSLCTNLADPTIEILFTFPHIEFLNLTDIYFTKASIAALGTTKTRYLAIKNCSLSPTICASTSELAKCFKIN